ncbi:hypothetical protein [Paenibacillus sp. ATY16]|uniref:hypothetical protein n=1 Tax=Paenibacillus sp. ATY16 TaxID=1759312 RepID=UPI00200D142B|nr:hypothetical protein [Paenibacillus sp. ATY16]MCK9859018.1 hypothetical protein [Paenibacillus sp. ATY16]
MDVNESMEPLSAERIEKLVKAVQAGQVEPYRAIVLHFQRRLQVADAKLTKVELSPYLGHPNVLEPEKWVEASESRSGYPYAYYKFKPDDQAYMEDAVLSLTYRKGDSTFRLSGTYGEFTSVTVFDKNPSAERIHEVSGIPIYHTNGQDTPYLTWLEPVGDGELMYWLNSNADLKQQLKFAEAVIKAAKH